MRIIVLGLRGFPNIEGGVEKHAEQLYPLLVKLGCDVTVMARSQYVSTVQKQWRGVVFNRIWAPKLIGLEAFFHSIVGVFYAGFMRPDILHIHAVGPAIVTPLARLLRLKVVVTHHGPDYDREKWGYFAKVLLRLGERLGMRFSHKRIAISNVIKQLVLDKYGLDSDIIPNGVALPPLSDKADLLQDLLLQKGRYILSVSRFVPEKRHIDLIIAFARSGLVGWKLVLVGKIDSDDRYCRKIISLASNTDGVVIAGFRTGSELDQLYTNAGFFVLPSSHEGLPIVALEALSYGVPVLVSNIPANKELCLPDVHYFPVGDTVALADSLSEFSLIKLNDTARQEQRAWVSVRYNWADIADKTLNIYKEILILKG